MSDALSLSNILLLKHFIVTPILLFRSFVIETKIFHMDLITIQWTFSSCYNSIVPYISIVIHKVTL